MLWALVQDNLLSWLWTRENFNISGHHSFHWKIYRVWLMEPTYCIALHRLQKCYSWLHRFNEWEVIHEHWGKIMTKVENINLQTSPAWCFMKDTSTSKAVPLKTWLREGVGMLLVFVIPWREGKWYRNRFLTCKFQIQSWADGFICLALCFSHPWFCLAFPKRWGDRSWGNAHILLWIWTSPETAGVEMHGGGWGPSVEDLWYCVTSYFCSPSCKYQCLLCKKQC